MTIERRSGAFGWACLILGVQLVLWAVVLLAEPRQRHGPATVTNYFSPAVKPAPVKVVPRPSCVVWLADLDLLVDDEARVAQRLPGRSFPVDAGATACGLKRGSQVKALAALLAQP